jgi:hypothetical protein
MRKHILIMVAALAICGSAHAIELGGVPVYLTIDGGLGYATTSVETNSRPFMLAYTGGITAAYTLQERWFFGLTTAYSYYPQFTDTANTGGINYRGSRWSIVSPMIGAKIGDFSFLAEIEFLGAYKLYKGTDVAYKSPIGGKLRALWKPPITTPVLDKMLVGLGFEYLGYSKLTQGSSETTLPSRQKFLNIGLTISYPF